MAGEPMREAEREDLGIRPGPGLNEETEFREKMEEESPDGRPPSGLARRESRVLFWSVLVLVTAVVVAALVWRSGSIVPGLIAVLLMVGFVVLAAWPTWNAGAERKIEERHVTEEMRGRGRGGVGRPT